MTPLTPLGGTEPKVDTFLSVTLSEVIDTALASYTARFGQEDAARSALTKVLGFPAPMPGFAKLGKPFGAFWIGPDQWMVMAPHGSHEKLASQLDAASGGTASVTEQNDAWCRFDLTGYGLADVFERLCPLNIRACKGGEATRTSIHHLGCFLIVASTNHVIVFGPRSSAGSIHHALITAIRSAH